MRAPGASASIALLSRVGTLSDEPDDRQYWWGRTPIERLEAVEFLRQMNYGHDATARLQRALEIAQRELRRVTSVASRLRA